MKQNTKRFNKTLRDSINFESLGFQDFENDNVFFDWKLKRETKNKMDVVSYGFSKDKWGDDMFLHPINSFIVFMEINKILLSLNNLSYNFYLYDPTIIEFPNFEKNNTENHYKIANLLFVINRVVYQKFFYEALTVFQEQLETSVLPFFDKIQTLQDVNDEILDKVDWNTYHKYISGETGAKVLIIMKLCNNPRYEAYKKRSDKLIAEQLNDPNYVKYTNILQNQQIIMDEIYNFLESGKYLEVI